MTQAAPPPANEKTRLEKLQQLMVLDTPPEALLDEITKLASEVCGTPIALISLIDEKRQWFKSNIGLEGVKETQRNLAFCAHAILEDQIMEVPDATLDKRFASNQMCIRDSSYSLSLRPQISHAHYPPLRAYPLGVRAGLEC